MKIFCSHCGIEVKERDILGVGTFDRNIGKYGGTTFVTFECPSCHRKEYQLLNQNPFKQNSLTDLSSHPELTPEEVLLSQREPIINTNDLIDFYGHIEQVQTIKEFLTLCTVKRKVMIEDQGLNISRPKDVYNLFLKHNPLDDPRMMILLVDNKNYLITWEILGKGSQQAISYEPRVVFRMPLLMNNDVALIIAQNADLVQNQPSKKDVLRIKRLSKAGKTLGIDILDYLIVHKGGYYSFEQLNLL